ncbi:hypothetical protein FGO68_gene350 [Halteria grandinella]|uniref:Gamma-glutamylcyclotransferase family protein n=1 Tax=Halteria grandinella TaxID=5974 RepID=A0A8J8NIA9_HALGN|nr:hypothetical protein FGO68_gene350 [Halteria grandinella]
MESQYLFTYGTLMRDYYNHERMQMSSFCEYVGRGQTVEKGMMFCNFIPYVKLCEYSNSYPIQGEVYSLTTDDFLLQLDALELPAGYKRVQVRVTMESGDTVQAWMYAVKREKEIYEEKSGDFRVYVETKLSESERKEMKKC